MKLLATTALGLSIIASTAIAAPVNGTGNLVNNFFNGSGNSNGSFTGVSTLGGELALRGKLRYDLAGKPQNVFNYDGDRTYIFAPSAANPPSNRSAFNLEFSIDVDSDGIPDLDLDDLTYRLDIDYDPTEATDFVSFDPINADYFDHKIGDQDTCADALSPCNGGTVAADSTMYQQLIATNSIAQQSWNLGFFAPAGFDPTTEGKYTIALTSFFGGKEVASTSIDIIYGDVPPSVPLPASLPMVVAGIGALGLLRRRRKA